MTQEKRRKIINGLYCHSDENSCWVVEADKLKDRCPYYGQNNCDKILCMDALDLIISQAERIHSLEEIVSEAMKNEWESLER